MNRTRIKICGLTRIEDVECAVAFGADAVGFVCFPASGRFVPPVRLAELARAVPAFVTPVLLFVNAGGDDVRRAIERVPNALLQFHGDESEAECAGYARPYVRAIAMAPGVDLLDCERSFVTAAALMADAPSEERGGAGVVFDWTRLPPAVRRAKPLILAGGLRAENVGAAIEATRPYAVDVSSGVEQARGIKSRDRLFRFFAAVRTADAAIQAIPEG